MLKIPTQQHNYQGVHVQRTCSQSVMEHNRIVEKIRNSSRTERVLSHDGRHTSHDICQQENFKTGNWKQKTEQEYYNYCHAQRTSTSIDRGVLHQDNYWITGMNRSIRNHQSIINHPAALLTKRRIYKPITQRAGTTVDLIESHTYCTVHLPVFIHS